MPLFFKNKSKEFDKLLTKAQKQNSEKRYKEALESLSKAEELLAGEEAQALLRQVQVARRTLTVEANLTTSVRMGDKLLEADARMQRAPGLVHVQYLTGRFKGWQVVEQDGLVGSVGQRRFGGHALEQVVHRLVVG